MATQVVFRKNVAFCGDTAMSARAVPGILEAWAGQLGTLQGLRAMHAELQAMLPADMVRRVAFFQRPVRQPSRNGSSLMSCRTLLEELTCALLRRSCPLT